MLDSADKSNGQLKDDYPNVEYLRPDFLKDALIIRNLRFAIPEGTITQVMFTSGITNAANERGIFCYTPSGGSMILLLQVMIEKDKAAWLVKTD